jgi:flagellar basal-body rod protein FlgG
MSTKGVYTAVSGAMAQSSRLDTIANNLANANTTSFKKDKQVFNEYLTAYEKMPDTMEVPRVPASVESFYDMNGGDKSFVDSAGTYTNFSQGNLKSTGGTLDVALEGKGFFEVLGPQGIRWTRNGSFQIDGTGRLVTKEGYPVLRDGAQDPTQRTIQIGDRNVTITDRGDIYQGDNLISRLSIVNFADPDQIQKQGNSLYKLKENSTAIPVSANETRLHQGYVEGSNVNVVEEMTDMITAQRLFETTQQAVKAFDHMDEKLISGLGKL